MARTQRPAPPPQPAPPAPPLEELDIAAFSELLRPTGLLIRDVANDGNCFFRAVSDQLYGSEHEHMTLRHLACDYLDAHADHYQHFIDEEQSFDEYVNEMRNDGVWADNLELQAISMACHVNIRVHQSGKPSYDIRNHPAEDATAIHLSYHFGEHYASVRPLHTAELKLPAQHDPLPLPRPPTKPDHQPESAQEAEASSNHRLRFRRHSDQHSVSAMWKRTERAHQHACAIVDKAQRAAKNFRTAHSATKRSSEVRNTALKIELEMKAARNKLETHYDCIDKARSSSRKRVRKLQKERRRRFTSASSSSHSDGSSTQPDESSDDEQRYRDSVRRQTETMHEERLVIENSARAALHVLSQLEHQSTKKTQGKHSKASKKREQEAKKRERKERRRRAQEKLARNEPEHIHRRKTPLPHEHDIAI